MAVITGSISRMNDVEIDGNAAHSTALLTKIGANINAIVDALTPIGGYLFADLTPTQLYDQGYDEEKWVLADGRDVTGSQYAVVTGKTTVPNACGRYPRAKDNGADVTPDGELSLGSTQDDQNKEHTHGVTDPGHKHTTHWTTNADEGDERQSWSGSSGEGHSTNMDTATTGISIQNQGGNEARPKTWITNVFIKIN